MYELSSNIKIISSGYCTHPAVSTYKLQLAVLHFAVRKNITTHKFIKGISNDHKENRVSV